MKRYLTTYIPHNLRKATRWQPGYALHTKRQWMRSIATATTVTYDSSASATSTQDLVLGGEIAADTALPTLLAANECILTAIHHDLGIPWWSTIVLGTLILRTSLTLPVAIYQQKAIGKMINLAPIVQSWAETLKVSVAKQSNRSKSDYASYQKELNKQYRQKVNRIYAQNGCARWKLLSLPWIQLPLFMCMTFSIRDLAALPLPWLGQYHTEPVDGLTHGGFAMWFDLTAVDPTMVFPFLVGAGNLLNIELNAWAGRHQEKTTSQKWITNGLRCLSIAFVPIAAHAPMALCLYWCTSSWYSVVQNLAFKVPSVRRVLGMPIIKSKQHKSSLPVPSSALSPSASSSSV